MRRRLPWVLAALSLLAVIAPVTARAQSPAAPAAGPAQAGGINTTERGGVVSVESKFVSSVGWVKPGERYPFTVTVRNRSAQALDQAKVVVEPPTGAIFLATNRLSAKVGQNGAITWKLGSFPGGSAQAPATRTVVIEARSQKLSENGTIVWRDLSAPATLTWDGGPDGGLTSRSHGPKVIPRDPRFDTARYGDRPFPVVPVEYVDREAEQPAEALDAVINSKDEPGSTFNLFQELSFGQLFPQGLVPSSGIETAGFGDYEPGFEFTAIGDDVNTCTGGATFGNTPDVVGTPLYETRIEDGWYQMPGNTAYYGADGNGSALVGAIGGIGALQAIDSGCGATGKAVYDAAQLADPEIDYNQFDTDKDGIVDFFMMVFAGLGGNGTSQGLGCDPENPTPETCPAPPYDNIWPHSSSLEFNYTDEATGLTGYISDDQLTDLEGTPQCWVDDTYTASDTCEANGGTGDDSLPVFVRVGPYNVNPESAIDKASVISHEYGHSLGLPDFYSTGSRETYGDWNLMATDKSQGMDVFSRQELGWVVPRDIQSRLYRVDRESDLDTHTIRWETPKGEGYTLQGRRVHNGSAWMAKLPSRRVIDASLVEEGASPTHVWWSGSGNDFGCAPQKGHNVDLYVPEMAKLPADTATTLTFKSYFDIEWDYDYGFVLASTDGGETWQSLASENGYTTPSAQNPNANPCQTKYGNGITGTGSSYDAGTAPADRVAGRYGPPEFVEDSYDLTQFAGESLILRFSYATDPGLARPGWFVDDVAIDAGETEVYATDFEGEGDPEDPRVFNGGCKEGLGGGCTAGWTYVDAASPSPADHSYYMEVRDRSGFDWNGMDENDRDPIGFLPGFLLVYSDEAHGYGNVGTDDPPAQTPLDSQPEPGDDAPDLDDAAFTAEDGDHRFSDSGNGWIDNYEDPRREEVCLADCDNPVLAEIINPFLFDYDCLTFEVKKMQGEEISDTFEPAPGNLTAQVDVERGDGCQRFDYGFPNRLPNDAPEAKIQLKPARPRAGQKVILDGTLSTDDRDGPSKLTYWWDLNNNGHTDRTGSSITKVWKEPGTRQISLTVIDSGNLKDEVIIPVKVRPAAG